VHQTTEFIDDQSSKVCMIGYGYGECVAPGKQQQQKLYTIKSIINLRVEQVSLKVFEKFVIINNNSKAIIQLQHQLQIH
jgi:hypothetical protein